MAALARSVNRRAWPYDRALAAWKMQSEAGRFDDGLRPVRDFQCSQHAGDMRLHRACGESQLATDQFVGLAFDEQREDLGLAQRETRLVERHRRSARVC